MMKWGFLKVFNALNYINGHKLWYLHSIHFADSLDSGHHAGEGWPPGLRCSTESTHLNLMLVQVAKCSDLVQLC